MVINWGRDCGAGGSTGLYNCSISSLWRRSFSSYLYVARGFARLARDCHSINPHSLNNENSREMASEEGL